MCELTNIEKQASTDRIYEADKCLAAALRTLCANKTGMPANARSNIGKAANLIATWCLLNRTEPTGDGK